MAESVMRLSCSAFWKGILSRPCLQLLLLCSLGCLVEGRPRTLRKCGKRDSQMGRIVGGKYTQPGEYPWMVSVHAKNHYTRKFEHICGGVILNEHYIVTAAHCIEHPTKRWMYEIYTGLHQLSKKSSKPAKKYKISEIIVHENFNIKKLHNDIALLRTKEPIRFEGTAGYVNGICLPQTDVDPTGWAVVTGWGDIKEGSGRGTDTLKAVEIPLVSRNECFETYGDKGLDGKPISIVESQICAGTSNKDACQYDSGGPLVQKNKRGIYTLIGIVSFGKGCGRNKYPGVYTKVASFMDWIEENMDYDSGGPLVQKNKRGIYTLIGIVSFGKGCGRNKYPGVYTKVASFMDWIEENMD